MLTTELPRVEIARFRLCMPSNLPVALFLPRRSKPRPARLCGRVQHVIKCQGTVTEGTTGIEWNAKPRELVEIELPTSGIPKTQGRELYMMTISQHLTQPALATLAVPQSSWSAVLLLPTVGNMSPVA